MGPSRNSKQEHNTATHDGGTNMEYIAGVNTYDDDEYTYEYMYVCNVINRKYGDRNGREENVATQVRNVTLLMLISALSADTVSEPGCEFCKAVVSISLLTK